MPIIYKIDMISALKEKGYNTNTLRKEKLLAEGVIQSLREKSLFLGQTLKKFAGF